MFSAVVIAAVPSAGPDRAIPIGTALALRGRLPFEVLTVDVPERSFDVGPAIVDYMQNRDGALLVMATSGAGLVSGSRGSITGHVLSKLCRPVLVIGPAVPEQLSLTSPTIVVATDRSHELGAALLAVESWQRTFGGGPPLVVEVMPTKAWPADPTDDAVERRHVDAVAAALAANGVDVVTHVLHGGDTAQCLLDFAAQVADAMFVATSDRWVGGRSHWYSTTRRLVQRSRRPVLVIPADLPGS